MIEPAPRSDVELPPEQERLPIGTVAAIGLVVLVVFALAVLYAYRFTRSRTEEALPLGAAPAARVGQDEIGIVNQKLFELEASSDQLRDAQRARLDSYGWVNRDAGVVHIPISKAMEQVSVELRKSSGEGEAP